MCESRMKKENLLPYPYLGESLEFKNPRWRLAAGGARVRVRDRVADGARAVGRGACDRPMLNVSGANADKEYAIIRPELDLPRPPRRASGLR